ncbi:MAG: GyrI-like domain-containing protein [Pseudomonadota bacterium]
MIATPHITHAEAQPAAVIRLAIARSEIQSVMGPAIDDVLAAVQAQGLSPAGPVFAHHYAITAETFDFDVGVPVSGPFTPAGRVKAGEQPGGRVARTVFHGNYSGLHGAWGEFKGWLEAEGHATAPDLWEVYASGPESDPDPASWRTELNKPLLG